jgi:hypothetical protein
VNLTEAKKITGGLSDPDKMPRFAFNLPAVRCKVGSALRKVVGSVCENCYALKNRYLFDNVQKALERRYQNLDDPLWVEAMVKLVRHYHKEVPYFRWHDSGDIRDEQHLAQIFEVCRQTPEIYHWLPTREYKVVQDFLKTHEKPENLCIRLSAHMVDQQKKIEIEGCTFSTVSTGAPPEDAFRCPASQQGNKCLTCRACWYLPWTDYPEH